MTTDHRIVRLTSALILSMTSACAYRTSARVAWGMTKADRPLYFDDDGGFYTVRRWGSWRETVVRRDIRDGTITLELPFSGAVEAIAYHNATNTLCAAGSGALAVFRADGVKLAEMQCDDPSFIYDVQFSQNAKWIAISHYSGKLEVRSHSSECTSSPAVLSEAT